MKKGMVYLYVTKEMGNISGYSCNAAFEHVTFFQDISIMIKNIKEHLASDEVYYASPLARNSVKFLRPKGFEQFYIVEVLYQQHNSWQGILHGQVQQTRIFKDIWELCDLLKADKEPFFRIKQKRGNYEYEQSES